MKANELMIGDWVYNKNINKPMQVYPMMLPQMFRQTPFATTEDYNIFPIPLTAEILEKNPIVKEFGYWDNEDGYFRLFAVPVLNLWSVNRLQDTLRLCGLTELADNFKI